jgi:hypothetical protein
MCLVNCYWCSDSYVDIGIVYYTGPVHYCHSVSRDQFHLYFYM